MHAVPYGPLRALHELRPVAFVASALDCGVDARSCPIQPGSKVASGLRGVLTDLHSLRLVFADHPDLGDGDAEAVEQIQRGSHVLVLCAFQREVRKRVMDLTEHVHQKARSALRKGDTAVTVDAPCRPDRAQIDQGGRVTPVLSPRAQEREGMRLTRTTPAMEDLVIWRSEER